MIYTTSPHCYDRVKLTFKDIFKLLIGKELKMVGLKIRMYKLPSKY